MFGAVVAAGPLRLRYACAQVGARHGGLAQASEPRQERGRRTAARTQGLQPPKVPEGRFHPFPGALASAWEMLFCFLFCFWFLCLVCFFMSLNHLFFQSFVRLLFLAFDFCFLLFVLFACFLVSFFLSLFVFYFFVY